MSPEEFKWPTRTYPNLNHITTIKSFCFIDPLYNYSSRETEKLTHKYGSPLLSKTVTAHEYVQIFRVRPGRGIFKEHPYSKSNCSENDFIKMFQFVADDISVGFAERFFQKIDSWHSNWNQLRPRLAVIFLNSYEAEFMQLIFAIDSREATGISVLVHRWWFVHKHPRVRKLTGSDVSCWAWDQRHERKQYVCFDLS